MAANEKPPSTQRSGLSLYANLLDPKAAGQTISRAPVVFNNQVDAQQDESVAKQNAALRFQPTKRPQPAQKPRPKPNVPKPSVGITESSSPASIALQSAPPSAPPQPPVKTTIADWTGDDDEGFYIGEKAQRGGRKKRKRNKVEAVIVQDWDDIYDPTRPNNYEDYKDSEERYSEIREWKDKLYRHRMMRHDSSDRSEEDGDSRPAMNRAFAPPSMSSFAPPPTFDDDSPRKSPHPVHVSPHPPPPPPAPAVEMPNDASGEEAYARRMLLSQNTTASSAPSFPHTSSQPPPPPSPTKNAPPPPPPEQPASSSISRAPVRYSLPPAPANLPSTDAELEAVLRDAAKEDGDEVKEDEATGDAPRSLRPGQKGFAARLMSKYGWTKGSGLGATGTGIVNPLRVQVEKRKKKSDAEGGGWRGPAGKGTIIGSQQGKNTSGGDEKAALSEVVLLLGMLDGVDVDAELEDGGLIQEIGEECGQQYGRVERVFIPRGSTSPSVPVFVKFTSQLSALRAVQALAGGDFKGIKIQASYYDAEKFEASVYE